MLREKEQKYQTNNTDKLLEYYRRIVAVARTVDIVDFKTFCRVMNNANQDVFFLRDAILRFNNIIEGFKAEFHAYVLSHTVFRNLKTGKFIIDQVMKNHGLKRLECTVDKNNKGLQLILKRLQFKSEGIVENGVFLNNQVIDGIRYSIIL